MRHIVTLIAMLAAALAAGCRPETPEAPTWTEDVRPIVHANCIRCHSPPQIEDAPPSFRIDKYEGEDRDGLPYDDDPDTAGIQDVGNDGISDYCSPDGIDVCGTGTLLHDDGSMAQTMVFYLDKPEDDPLHMPPDFTLPERQIEVIRNWADTGAPKGPPLEGNLVPTMALTSDFEREGDSLVASYSIDDPDFDLVTGRLEADGPIGDPIVVTWDLISGRGQISWNISDVQAGTYELTAIIDDASAEEEIRLGSVTVP